MPRTITSTLQAKFDTPLTYVYYLVQINGSQILRWANGGTDPVVSGVPWSTVDFEVSGLKWSGGSLVSANLRAQNFDNAVAAFLINETVSDITVDIFQIEGSVLADPQALGTLVMDDAHVSPDYMEVTLISSQAANAMSPRRLVDVFNGFKFALPIGTKIPWGDEIFILEANRG